MRSDRRILPLILLFLVLIGGIFYAMQEDVESDELTGAVEDSPLGADLKAQKATIPGAGKLEGRAAGSKAFAITNDRSFAQDTKLNFGPQIQSGDCIATFTLLDKKDVPLIASQLESVELWRKLGDYWILEHADLDKKNSRVICAGSFGTGLEPGEYELGVSCKGYGAKWHKFKIASGQNITGQIKLPHWRRVIRLRYVDEEGKPLARIPTKPEYEASKSRLPRRVRSTPLVVLAEPPTYGAEVSEESSFELEAKSASRKRREWSGGCELTEDGIWYMEVFAGGYGELTQEFRRWRKSSLRIRERSTFEEEQWDSFDIKLTEDHLQPRRLERASPNNEDDIGNRHVLNPKEDLGPLATARLGSPDIPRVIFDINSDMNVVPVIQSYSADTTSWGGVEALDRKARLARGQWYTDVFLKHGPELIYAYNDGCLLKSDDHKYEFERGRVGRNPYLITINDTVAANLCTIETTMPTPTSKAWARGLKVGWILPRRQRYPLRVNQAHGNRFSVRTALGLSVKGESPITQDIGLTFMGEGRKEEAEFKMQLDDEQKKALTDGSLHLTPETQGIILRAVDLDGAGLPWVEASLLPVSRVHTAFSIRKRMNRWKVENRNDRHYTNEPVHNSLPGSTIGEPPAEEIEEEVLQITEVVEKFTDKDLREILKGGLYDEFDTDEERRFFASNYAWYNTHRRLKSDRRGYLINWSHTIEPGERFALFLWSKSRDHLVADEMILFTAKEGLTDLGAILLPDYKKIPR